MKIVLTDVYYEGRHYDLFVYDSSETYAIKGEKKARSENSYGVKSLNDWLDFLEIES